MKKREPGLKPLRNAGLAAIFVAGTVGASALYGQILHQGAQPGAELDARADSAPDDVHWQLPPPPADLAASDEATPMAPAGAPPASSAKPAKKNIWKAVTDNPVFCIFAVSAAFFTLALANKTQRLPMVVDRFQKLIITPFIANGA